MAKESEIGASKMSTEQKEKFLLSLVRSNRFWKYLFLSLLLLGSLFLSTFNFETKQFVFRDAALNFTQGVLASLIFSIMYDVFTRRDQIQETKIIVEDMTGRLASRIIDNYPVEFLTESQRYSLAKQAATSDILLRETVRHAVPTEKHCDNVFFNFIKPLWRESILVDLQVDITLTSKADDSSAYEWRVEQRFKQHRDDPLFRMLITSNNMIASRALSSSFRCDHVLAFSDISPGQAEAFVRKKLSFAAIARVDGKRIETPVPWIVNNSLDCSLITKDIPNCENELFIVDFDLRQNLGSEFVFSFTAENRLDDPYYFWSADRPCFLDRIVFDYRGISQKIGRVSVVPSIGNHSCDVTHDVERSRIALDANGLLWPGQGAAFIWRNKANVDGSETKRPRPRAK